MSKLALILSLLASPAFAGNYPTVREIEHGLGLHPGVMLPKLVPAQGRGWAAYYVSAHAVGSGEYDVRIRLRPQ